MTTADLLDNLADRGFVLTHSGDTLLVRPASQLTATDREAIAKHKPAILTYLIELGRLRQNREGHQLGKAILQQIRRIHAGTANYWPVDKYLYGWAVTQGCTWDEARESLAALVQEGLVSVDEDRQGQRPVPLRRVILQPPQAEFKRANCRPEKCKADDTVSLF